VLLRGHRLRRPAEDTRQLGAEAITIDGVVRLLWRPRTSKDRLAAEGADPAGEVIAAARTWLPRHRHDAGKRQAWRQSRAAKAARGCPG
jgi:hypothetical protein